jgi:hypothetical protein
MEEHSISIGRVRITFLASKARVRIQREKSFLPFLLN